MVIPDVEYRLSVVSDGLRSASSELEDALFVVRHLDDEINDINNKATHPEDEN